MINQHYSDHQFPINSMITRICHIRISQSPIYIIYIYISSPNISYPYGGFLKWGYPQIIHFCFCFSAFPLKTIHFGGTPYFPLCLYVPIVYHIFPDFPPRCSYMFQYVRYIPLCFPICSHSFPIYSSIWSISYDQPMEHSTCQAPPPQDQSPQQPSPPLAPGEREVWAAKIATFLGKDRKKCGFSWVI